MGSDERNRDRDRNIRFRIDDERNGERDDRGDYPEAANILREAMAVMGLSAPGLSDAAGEGGVSTSSIRAYLGGDVKPRPPQALKLAQTVGPDFGPDLLAAWGYEHLSQRLLERAHSGEVGAATSDTVRRLRNEIAHLINLDNSVGMTEEELWNIIDLRSSEMQSPRPQEHRPAAVTPEALDLVEALTGWIRATEKRHRATEQRLRRIEVEMAKRRDVSWDLEDGDD